MGMSSQADPYKTMADAITNASQIQANSAQQAMNIEQNQFNSALNFMTSQYNQAIGMVTPYMQMGTNASNQLQALMGLSNNEDPLTSLYKGYNQLQTQLGSYSDSNAGVSGNTGGINQPGFNTNNQPYNAQLNEYNQIFKALGITPPNNNPKDMQTWYNTESGFPTQNGVYNGPMSQAIYNSRYGNAAAASQQAPDAANIDFSKISGNANLNAIWQSLNLPSLNKQQQPTAQSIEDLITSNPQYQFQYQQGMQALQNSAAGRGMLNSGANSQDLINYGQGMASNAYSQQLQQLSNMVQQGLSASTFGAQTAQQQGQQVAGMNQQLGDTLGSGVMAQGNALANGLIGSTRWNIASPNFGGGGGGMGAIGQGLGMLGGLFGGGGGGGMMGMLGGMAGGL